MKTQNIFGLTLSGGGYRAAAFHLGTLNKLHHLGLLEKVDVLSTISGGSITGAAWLLSKEDFSTFYAKMKHSLGSKSVIRHVVFSAAFLLPALLFLGLLGVAIAFTIVGSYPWLSYPLLIITLAILFRFQFRILPLGRLVERAYDHIFFKGAVLDDFKERPTIAIGSSNLETGRPFTFSRHKMSDSAYVAQYDPMITFKKEKFPVSRAVTASSCVPFAFTPVEINAEFFRNPTDVKRVHPQLVDGGVYDNQGIQKLTEEKSSYACKIVVVSDAGGAFRDNKVYPNTIALLLRTVDLFMYRIKGAQMQKNLYYNMEGAARPIAYFSLGWEPEKCLSGFVSNLADGNILKEVVDAHALEPQWLAAPKQFEKAIIARLKANIGYDNLLKLSDAQWRVAAKVGTNLTPLPKDTLDYLIIHAEALAELQIRLYCPMLF